MTRPGRSSYRAGWRRSRARPAGRGFPPGGGRSRYRRSAGAGAGVRPSGCRHRRRQPGSWRNRSRSTLKTVRNRTVIVRNRTVFARKTPSHQPLFDSESTIFVKKHEIENRGISPLVTILFMIIIAVTASAISFSWIMSLASSQSIQAQTRLRIDMVDFTNFTNVTVAIRNIGSVSAMVDSISIRKNVGGSTGITQFYTSKNSIEVNKVKNFYWTKDNLSPNTSYVIRITASTGIYYEITEITP